MAMEEKLLYRGTWNVIIPKELLFNAGLSTEARMLWIILRSYVSETSPEPYPSIDTLMRVTGKGRGSIKKYRKELIDAGYLERKEQRQGNRGQFGSMIYILHEKPITVGQILTYGQKTITGQKTTIGQNLPNGEDEPTKKNKESLNDSNEIGNKDSHSLVKARKISNRHKNDAVRNSGDAQAERPRSSISEWPVELLPARDALREILGKEPTIFFLSTIRNLLSPVGMGRGARIDGSSELLCGFSIEQVMAGIEEMGLHSHFSPRSLIKHVAGLFPVNGNAQKSAVTNGRSAAILGAIDRL